MNTGNSFEDIGYSVHLHYEDPRYVTLVVQDSTNGVGALQGRQNYGLDFDPATGTIGTTRQCICGAWAEDTCVCDLGFEED